MAQLSVYRGPGLGVERRLGGAAEVREGKKGRALLWFAGCSEGKCKTAADALIGASASQSARKGFARVRPGGGEGSLRGLGLGACRDGDLPELSEQQSLDEQVVRATTSRRWGGSFCRDT